MMSGHLSKTGLIVLVTLSSYVSASLIPLIPPPHEAIVSIPHYGNLKGGRSQTIPESGTYNPIFNPGKYYYSFRGIPYANPPPRFSPATLRTTLTSPFGLFDATKPQLACWQEPAVPAYNLVPPPYTEDCLTLNVFSPRVPSLLDPGHRDPLPVIVFIHGGSFVRWSGNVFDGSRLLNRDVVLVTINYRLNLFGFWSTETDEAPGNLGLYDQILALHWVQNYIKSFGGDPTRVTIAGQSAGAASVMYLMDSPMATGLFHGAISSSGDDLSGWAEEPSPLADSLTVAGVFGCYNASNPNLAFTLACMRAVPADVLVQGMAAFYTAPAVQSYPLTIPKTTPVSPYVSLVTNGLQSPVPLMIGSNKNDGSFLLSRTYTQLAPTGLLQNPAFLITSAVSTLLSSTSFNIVDSPLGIYDTIGNTYLGPARRSGVWSAMTYGFIDIFSVWYFKAPIHATANGHSLIAPTYVYSFDYYGNLTLYPYLGGVPEIPRGVTHVDDLMYVFNFGAFTTDNDRAMSKQMLDYYANFAYTGNPNNAGSTAWPAYNPITDAFLKINTQSQVGFDYVAYWVGASLGIV